MPAESHSHLLPEEIVRYSAGQASEEEAARWDEHLLICGECRQAVSEQDYRAAMRSAARELRRSSVAQASPDRRRISKWLPAAALVAALAIIALALLPRWNTAQTPFAITLTTTRGPAIEAHAPARTPLRVTPDFTGLPTSPAYRLEVVDAVGHLVWRGEIAGVAQAVTLPGLASGIYFARVYSPEGLFLREYGLEIGK